MATASGTLMLRLVNTRLSAATVDVSVRGEAAHCELLAEGLPFDCVTMACADQAVNSWSSPGLCRPKPLSVVPIFTSDPSGTTHAQRSCGVLAVSVQPLSFTVCTAGGYKNTRLEKQTTEETKIM